MKVLVSILDKFAGLISTICSIVFLVGCFVQVYFPDLVIRIILFHLYYSHHSWRAMVMILMVKMLNTILITPASPKVRTCSVLVAVSVHDYCLVMSFSAEHYN